MTDLYTQDNNWPLNLPAGQAEAYFSSGAWERVTVAEAARMRAGREPDRVAVQSENDTLTYSEAVEQGEALARALLDLGLRPGDTLAFQLPNWLETAVINLACAFAGFVVNPVIPIYRQAELRVILKDARARLIFIPHVFRNVDFAAILSEVRPDLPELAHVVQVRGASDGLQPLIEHGRTLNTPLPEVLPESAKMLIYTSGTTGLPKGVIYGHAQAKASIAYSFDAWGLEPDGTVTVVPTPVTHVTGYAHGLEGPFLLGTRTILMERWDAAEAVALIDRHSAAYMIGATPFLSETLKAAQAAQTHLPSLKVFACGGAEVPPDLIRRANTWFANGVATRVFGASEVPMVTQGCIDDCDLSASTDGRVFRYQVRLIDKEGRDVPNGSEGEIIARGPSMFLGYTDPDATRKAVDSDGFFHTGDLGRLSDDGIITVTGRIKDLIIRGGENLSAKEIEDALALHATIADLAVVGAPHERLGECVAVFVVTADGCEMPDTTSLGRFLSEAGIAPQKRPEYVFGIDTLPRTASGKVQKHLLRDEVKARLGTGRTPDATDRT